MPRRKGSARTEKASAARRGEAASADGDAAVAEEPVLESNDEPQGMQLDDATDDPVGRRIDDVLTTAPRARRCRQSLLHLRTPS